MHMSFSRCCSVLIACCPLLSTNAPGQTPTAARNYVLAADDVVEVKVFQEDDLTTRARISRDGSISFPLLGAVSIGGKTAQEAGELIRCRLQQRFLVNP
ncbi:MAG: polysaccharide biosynthesis/export family protein, partial [Verrucomicrobiota bacterium]|nr:polysaccharide biosynthesis/export family protein [Verrucomicrobiota bacterium]